jgi:hypothetical protein
LDDEQRRAHVDREHPVEVLWGGLLDECGRPGGRVVDQDVQALPGKARLQPGKQGVHVAVRAEFGP